MISELANEILKYGKKIGFEDVAVEAYDIDRVMIKIANNQPSIIQRWSGIDLSIYLARNKRILIYSMRSENRENVFERIKNALNTIKTLEESFIYAPLPEPKDTPRSIEGAFDDRIYNIISDPADLISMIINEAVDSGADRLAGTIDLEATTRCLATSKEFDHCERYTGIVTYIRAFSGEGSGHWGYASRVFDKNEILDVARKASYYATQSRKLISIEPGKYNLILSPLVIGNLSNYIASAASGFSKIIGTSFLAKYKVGDEIAGSVFTLCDTPVRHDLYGSTSFDSEGIATFNKCIIESGRLKNFLHNTKTARFFNEKTTGNAGWIMPQAFTLTIPPGDIDEDNMASELRDGLIVNNNWYTRLQNAVEGIFSTVTRDALLVVKNGEIVGSARRMRIADTFPRLLKNISNLTKKLYKVSWWEIYTAIESPFILVNDVNVTKPTA